MHVIGEETSQRLDVVPAQFRVIVTQRPKYACRGCEEAVVQAPAPERLMAAQFKSLSRASCLDRFRTDILGIDIWPDNWAGSPLCF
jgi:hypothetical protein